MTAELLAVVMLRLTGWTVYFSVFCSSFCGRYAEGALTVQEMPLQISEKGK